MITERSCAVIDILVGWIWAHVAEKQWMYAPVLEHFHDAREHRRLGQSTIGDNQRPGAPTCSKQRRKLRGTSCADVAVDGEEPFGGCRCGRVQPSVCS